MVRALRFIMAVAFLALTSIAQELDCEVNINLERLPSGVRDNLRGFKTDIERYLNENRWTNEDLGGEKIKCTFNIFFQSGTQDGRYSAQVFIGSQRPVYVGNDKSGRVTPILRILDERWEFTYLPNQRMVRDDFQFDPLTDFLDFYAYLIIGFDLETYVELTGSSSFQRALNICNQAAATAYGRDWQQTGGTYSRFGIVDELMNARYQPFRFAFHTYHFEGIDLLQTDTQKGLENMLKAIETIGELREKQDPRSILVRTFFDAKYQEIAESFLRYGDRSVYRRLAAADPAHQGTYEEFRTRR